MFILLAVPVAMAVVVEQVHQRASKEHKIRQ